MTGISIMFLSLEIKRYGLDIINESGELVPGPAVNSLIQWNKKRYGTEWGETDFTETILFMMLVKKYKNL